MKQGSPHLLVWGSRGFIGSKAVSYFSRLGYCDFVSRNSKGGLDFFNARTRVVYNHSNSAQGIQQVLNDSSAEVVLNAAAKADIDFCARYPAEAKRSNVELPIELALYTQELEKRLIHLSTDAIFGQTNSMHSEDMPASPISIYGKMKLDSELAVHSLNSSALIIRTRPFGHDSNGNNLFNFFANKLMNAQAVNGYTNSFFTPIFVSDLLQSIDALARDKAFGIWHVAGSERISKYEFGTMISRHLHTDSKLVIPTKYEIVDDKSARGLDTSLDTQKFRALYGTVSSVDSGILRSIKEMTS